MTEFIFTIPGEPMAKARPRASVVGGHAKVYTPAKTANYEAKVALAFKQAYQNAEPISNPISVHLYFWFSLNKGDYNSKGELNEKGRRKLHGSIKHTKKPDIDNVVKTVLDGLNGIAFVDDSSICEIYARKYYGREPYVYVRISEDA